MLLAIINNFLQLCVSFISIYRDMMELNLIYVFNDSEYKVYFIESFYDKIKLTL